MGLIVAVLVILSGTSCRPRQWIGLIADDSIEAVAIGYLDALLAGDLDQITRDIDSPQRSPDLPIKLLEMRQHFPNGKFLSRELINYQSKWRVTGSARRARHDLIYEYHYPDTWVVARVVFEYSATETPNLKIIQVAPRSSSSSWVSMIRPPRFSPSVAIILSLAAVVLGGIVVTFIVCLRTPFKRRKWLWALFILVGFGQILVDTGSGKIGLRLLSIQIGGVSVIANGPGTSWVWAVSFPLGAILFWVRRRELVAREHRSKTYIPPLPTALDP
ncbi:hypothetical protein PXH66_19190 [Synoicihabitans lomoniglobus]|uniref:Uncharacterized protein n=1 Tax=Synoicihabitans lomoniglobus TaxID=2909285 RepID=A0AAE9ZSK9_9BACT|nr:hypothetical protein PXH66_19190 [Opitutaceae bacterium LMO-M01]